MKELLLVVAAGLFSLGGVFLGALLTPLTQLYLERKREQRACNRAKLLVAGELLHAQLILRTASALEHWPPVEDWNVLIPTSAWHESKSSLVGKIHDDLWNQLVIAFAILETDRARFVAFSRAPSPMPLPAKEAARLKEHSNNLGRLRRQLGGSGVWPDDLDEGLKQQSDNLNAESKR